MKQFAPKPLRLLSPMAVISFMFAILGFVFLCLVSSGIVSWGSVDSTLFADTDDGAVPQAQVLRDGVSACTEIHSDR